MSNTAYFVLGAQVGQMRTADITRSSPQSFQRPQGGKASTWSMFIDSKDAASSEKYSSFENKPPPPHDPACIMTWTES